MDVKNFLISLFGKSVDDKGRESPQPTKTVEATREVIKRLEETKKTPATLPKREVKAGFEEIKKAPVSPPLQIRSELDWKNFEKKLCKLDKFERFVAENSANWKWFAKSLDKVKKDISKMTPEEFDEYTTENVVTATVNMSKKFIAALDSCSRTIKNPTKDSTAAQELYNLIEEYLSELGICPMNFKAGDNYEEWADLGMSEQPTIESTKDKIKHNILKEINVQPHFIYYLDEHDKKARRVFGAQCVAYAYKD